MKRNPNLGAAIDERLSAAIDKAHLLITLNNQKQNARLKLESDLTFAQAGGIFKIDQHLISFVHTLVTLEHTDGILLDKKLNPIYIDNLQLFLETIIDIYYESMNRFSAEFEKIKKTRKVENLMGDE